MGGGVRHAGVHEALLLAAIASILILASGTLLYGRQPKPPAPAPDAMVG